MKLCVFILCVFGNIGLVAQNSFFDNHEISLTVGAGKIDVERTSPSQNLDFMNYIYSYPQLGDYAVVKLGYKCQFLSKMSADFKMILMDGLYFDNYDVSTHYFIKPWIGIGAGSMLHKNWITYFEEYHQATLPDYYIHDENVRQFTAYELGVYISPTVKLFDKKNVSFQFTCDIGISSFMKEETDFYHKKKLSNKRMYFNYETKTKFQPYIHPKMDINVKVLNGNMMYLSLIGNASYYSVNRSIDYNRTTQLWTAENESIEQVTSPKHSYTRFELNVGTAIGW